jgi:hypothetical protein
MFFKVRVKPTDAQVIQLSADFYENFTNKNAMYFTEIAINADTTLATVQNKAEVIANWQRARAVVAYQSKVVKLLTQSQRK